METNIKVAVRCRPMSSSETKRGCGSVINIKDNTVSIKAKNAKESEAKSFTFDHCYFTDTTQTQVFNDLGKNVVYQGLDGYNGTIFAYGQSGSGKTHTMMGSPEDKGIIPLISSEIFRALEAKLENAKSSDGQMQCLITVSYLEIYNETIKDLLNPSPKQLKIHEHPDEGIYVKDLCELIVRTPDDLLRLIEQGNTVRRVASTNLNDTSSRSHACFSVKIEQKTTTELEGGVTREQLMKAKLNLVDLAGSERAAKTGAQGQTLKEGAKINLSLMTLGTVINALAAGAGGTKGHVPYRDSQLTRLLQESLGGNAATVMIAAISPADYNFDETLGTLKYANRAKSIENVVTRNEDVNEKMIRDLKETIERLKAELEQGSGSGAQADPAIALRLKEMEEEQINAWDEREKLSQALEAERQSNMNSVISTMMKDMKDQKIDHMKQIKLLTIEKSDLAKKQKNSKEKCDALKASLDSRILNYNNKKAKYEENRPKEGDSEELAAIKKAKKKDLATEMQEMLGDIEKNKMKWVEKKDQLKILKSKISDIEDGIDSAKADLVVTHGLLDQNDKLRQKIQEEERAKAKREIEKEMNEAKEKLNIERTAVRSTVIAEVELEVRLLKDEISEANGKLASGEEDRRLAAEKAQELQEYADVLEGRLAEAGALYEKAVKTMELNREDKEKSKTLARQLDEAEREKQEMLASFEKERQQYQAQISDAKKEGNVVSEKSFEEQKYLMFKTLMDGFNAERKQTECKFTDLQGLLSHATKDIIYLQQQNDDLNNALNDMAFWEPEIAPSKPVAAVVNGTTVSPK